jgi:OmpA-OmpF porin, OOP family
VGRFFTITFLFFSIRGLCQNLILNGSFESYINCVDDYGDVEVALGWFQPLNSSSDYFNSCCHKKNFLSVPSNYVGYQKPHGLGEAYIGLYLFDFDKRFKRKGYYNREYIQTRLTHPLRKGKKYRIVFYYSLADQSNFFSDHFSICLSHDRELKRVKLNEHIFSSNLVLSKSIDRRLAKDTISWNEVNFEFLSQGGEEFLTIGLFKEDLSIMHFNKLVSRSLKSPMGLVFG